MFRSKPAPRFVFLILTLVLFLTLISPGTATVNNDDEDDLEAFEELVALDEEADAEIQEGPGSGSVKPSSEAEVLSKAQRIVIELNTDSTKRVIAENEFVLVLGYAPWDPRSAELMPQFAEAATELKQLGIGILMAKLDGERYTKAASAIGIQGFPSLLLFVNGTSQAYTGGFTSEEIVIWARKKAGNPVIRISSATEAKEFLNKHATFIVGLFAKYEGSEHEEFVKAATSDNEIQFVETSSTDVASALFPDIGRHKTFLGLVKSEPERYTRFEGNFQIDDILQFLDHNKFPLVTAVTELNMAKVYSSSIRLQVYVFAEADDFKNLFEPLQNVARKFKSEIMFLYVDIKNDNLAKPFLTILGIEESTDTIVAAFNNQISSKYLLETEPTPSKIEDFCFSLLHGTQAPYYKSQPIPDNTDSIIQTIVGKTFDDLVLSSSKNIILEVHTPWCLNCETTSKQVEKLAKHFVGLDNLVFARIDASANEHPKLQVDDYPALLFYPAADKTHPINLPTKSSLKELAALINKKLKKDQDNATKDEL